MIDFLGDKLRQTTRGSLGPWTTRNFAIGHALDARSPSGSPFPPAPGRHHVRRLLGATGVLDVDGMTIDLVPWAARDDQPRQEPGFRAGRSRPDRLDGRKRRPRSLPRLSLPRPLELRSPVLGARRLALPVAGRTAPLAGGDGPGQGQGPARRTGGCFGLSLLPRRTATILRGWPRRRERHRLFNWADSFDWREDRAVVPVPNGAVPAVLQVEEGDAVGSIQLDDVSDHRRPRSPRPGLVDALPRR